MYKKLIYLMLAVIILMYSNCANTSEGEKDGNNKKDQLVTIATKFGDIKLVLYDETPQHKENFLQLAKSGRYDSTLFYRVIKGFMIQGGGIDMKENDLTQRTIPAEFVSKYHHKRGALAAARTNNPEKASSWCQFYIVQGEVITEEQIKNQFAIDQALFRKYYNEYVELEENADLKNELISLYNSGDAQGYQDRVLALVPECESHFNVKIRKEYSPQRLADYSTVGGSPHLDDQYTVFGMVVDGLEVVDSIAAQSTTPADKPLEDIYITMKVDEMSRKKITKEFGYQYPE